MTFHSFASYKQGRLEKKKTLPVMLGSIETLDLVNWFKFIQTEEPHYKTLWKHEEGCSSVKLGYQVWKK